MKRTTIGALGVLGAGLLLLFPPSGVGVAQAQLIAPTGAFNATGSWNWGINFLGPWDFDQMDFVYRPDLDTGAGRFESPFANDFVGLGSAGWGLVNGDANTFRLAGPSLNGIAPTNNDVALGMTLYQDGDPTARTGFNVGLYDGGNWVLGLEVRVGENTNFFAYQVITQDEFNASAAAVPEPASMALLALGLAVVGGARRKRKRS